MVFKNYISVLISSILGALTVHATDFPRDLEKWFVAVPPEINSEQWVIAQGDFEHEWVVTASESTPLVALLKRDMNVPSPLPFEIKEGEVANSFYGTRIYQSVRDGWIISFNNGEFGGELWWFSRDGHLRYKIKNCNILGFFQTDSGLLALTGLAHGVGSKGGLDRLFQNKEGNWLSETYIELQNAPHIATKNASGSLIIATSKQLIKFDTESKKIITIVDNLSWMNLYPNSIVITKSGTIFVGMRHGVAKIEKSDSRYKTQWLLPDKAFANQPFREGFK